MNRRQRTEAYLLWRIGTRVAQTVSSRTVPIWVVYHFQAFHQLGPTAPPVDDAAFYGTPFGRVSRQMEAAEAERCMWLRVEDNRSQTDTDDENVRYNSFENSRDVGMEDMDSIFRKLLTNHSQYLQECYDSGVDHINLNLAHLQSLSNRLYRKVIAYPADVIPFLEIVVNRVFAERFNRTLSQSIELRPFNAEKTRNMRGLGPEDVGRLITITGMISHNSALIPIFKCSVCAVEIEVVLEEAPTCADGTRTHCCQLIQNRSLSPKKHLIEIQEEDSEKKPGMTSIKVLAYADNSISESVSLGDRIMVTGIMRMLKKMDDEKQRSLAPFYRTSIDALHFRKLDTARLHQDNGETLTEERIKQIVELSRRPDIMDALAHAIAPSIYEHDDVKKGVLCLLFGGTRKNDETTNKTKLRSEINILLCGDSGPSKGQILYRVAGLLPRCQFFCGSGFSSISLSPSVNRDADTNQLVVKTGALVQADKGVLCLNNMEKLNKKEIAAVEENMIEHTVSIAKAGIICKLNARASILAAANPIDWKWNRNKKIAKNLSVPPTLLSRFDLIFVIDDIRNEYKGNMNEDQTEEKEEIIEFFHDYIAYAKANIHPKLGEDASQRINEKYLLMKKAGAQHGQITAYPRQRESLIRLSEAHAKIRLSQEVSVEDVDKAFTLWREALRQSAHDPVRGRVDVAIPASVSSRRNAVEAMCEVILKQLQSAKGFITSKALYQTLKSSDKTCSKKVFDEALNELSKKESIARSGECVRFQPVDT